MDAPVVDSPNQLAGDLKTHIPPVPKWWADRPAGHLRFIETDDVADALESAKPRALRTAASSLTIPCERTVEALAGLELLARSHGTLKAAASERLATGLFRFVRNGSQVDDALLFAEVQWKFSLLFPAEDESEELREAGRHVLNSALYDGTDLDGVPAAHLSANLARWVACLTRAAAWGKWFGEPLFDPQARERFALLVARCVDLCAMTDRLAIDETQSPGVAEMLQTAAKLVGIKKDDLLRKRLSWINTPDAAAEVTQRYDRKHPPGFQSDESRFALLRSHRLPAADLIAVTHDRPLPRIEVVAAGKPLLQGDWGIEIAINQKPLALADDWDCVCWHSDEDGEYIELQQVLKVASREVRIERQIFLARKGNTAVFADSIAASARSEIQYRCELPLSAGYESHPAPPTREVQALGERPARFFPLFLPQHTVESALGHVAATERTLTFERTAQGGIYAPIVMTWDPGDYPEVADWRRLTITEGRETIHEGNACAYRLRIGPRQFFLYHSLTESETPRAAMGHHTPHETVIGKVKSTGEVKALLLVE